MFSDYRFEIRSGPSPEENPGNARDTSCDRNDPDDVADRRSFHSEMQSDAISNSC